MTENNLPNKERSCTDCSYCYNFFIVKQTNCISLQRKTFFNVEFTISFTKSYFLIEKKVAKKTHYIDI